MTERYRRSNEPFLRASFLSGSASVCCWFWYGSSARRFRGCWGMDCCTLSFGSGDWWPPLLVLSGECCCSWSGESFGDSCLSCQRMLCALSYPRDWNATKLDQFDATCPLEAVGRIGTKVTIGICGEICFRFVRVHVFSLYCSWIH